MAGNQDCKAEADFQLFAADKMKSMELAPEYYLADNWSLKFVDAREYEEALAAVDAGEAQLCDIEVEVDNKRECAVEIVSVELCNLSDTVEVNRILVFQHFLQLKAQSTL